ncbi:hypothetical protein SAMN05216167_107114 [Spirosoma endophyticum]|uniref:Uncharacterized protein n=1 Tax=Spirosoma endophyticum TaxID=662367 RepID=A0A1I1VID6_9BACT|nr:hypothetical protein SAMN05216167_107114 [Spirosoma endophyticum]
MGIVKEVNVQENYSKEANKTGLKVNIDIHELPKDTYYLQGVYSNGKVQSTRVVIQ